MARVVVKGLAQYGMITDTPPFETPANAWTETINCSFTNGGVTKAGIRMPVMNKSIGEINKIYNKDSKIFYGTPDKIYVTNGITNIDVCRPEAYVADQEWYATELSNVIIFCNSSNVPQMYRPADSKFSDLTAWGKENGQKEWRTSKIRAFKNFLIAVGTQEDGVEYPQRIRWSDLALPNEVPPSWDATDTTKSAGFNDLSEARGELVDAVQMGEYMMLYTTEEVFVMTYVGGNEIFSFRKLFDNISIIAPECAAPVNGGHIVLTSSDVVLHNGSSWKSIIDGKIKDKLYQAIITTSKHRIRVQQYPSKQEVWILYPSTINSYLDRCAIYSTSTGTWTLRELPNVTAINYGVVPNDNNLIYDYQDYTYDADNAVNNDPYNGIGQDFVRNSLYVSTIENVWWAMDEGSSGTVNLPSTAIKQNIDFDDYGMEAADHKMVKGIYPQIKGAGKMYISVGVAENPYDDPYWSDAQEFDIRTDRKVDFRTTGRYISVRFQSFEEDPWTLTSYAIDVVPRGTR